MARYSRVALDSPLIVCSGSTFGCLCACSLLMVPARLNGWRLRLSGDCGRRYSCLQATCVTSEFGLGFLSDACTLLTLSAVPVTVPREEHPTVNLPRLGRSPHRVLCT